MRFLDKKNISIVGGAGHVGFPLGLVLASKGFNINLIDKNKKSLEDILKGKPPFLEEGANKLLRQINKRKKIKINVEINSITFSKFIIICIGTPITKSLKPKLTEFLNFFRILKKYIKKDQIIIIRSSIYPGTFFKISKILGNKNKNIFYCPERIVQGKSIKELPKLPQIISGSKNKNLNLVNQVFKKISSKIIKTGVTEAELIKLFSNANRYINFAIANQFFLICKQNNVDYTNVRKIMRDGYERNTNLAKAGFTAGPCLLKDTMQLSSFYKRKFNIGYEAMKINEGIPKYIIKELLKIKNIKKKIIGVLGLSFKAETDDIRDSLSIVLVNLLHQYKLKVITSDEYYESKNNVSKEYLIKKSDIIIIGAPHKKYSNLTISKNKILIDIWK